MTEDPTALREINRIKMFEFGHRGYEQSTEESSIRHPGSNLGSCRKALGCEGGRDRGL